jgi:hypothetical protein
MDEGQYKSIVFMLWVIWISVMLGTYLNYFK